MADRHVEAVRAKLSTAVAHPPHYQGDGIEVIEVIEAFRLGFARGNTLKYLLRAGRKEGGDEIEDLEKAVWYLHREIARLRRDLDDG